LAIAAADVSAAAPPDGNSSMAVQRSGVRLVIHDRGDGLYDELDANGDGRLGEREVETVGDRLRRCDGNGDGALRDDELPYVMIVAFVRGEPLGERSFTLLPRRARPSVDEAAPAWFVHADLNRDGDVSRREFLGSLEKFAALDASGDGYIDAAEAAAVGGEAG
jgi:hypothetical protein